jgi:hypothetical protein
LSICKKNDNYRDVEVAKPAKVKSGYSKLFSSEQKVEESDWVDPSTISHDIDRGKQDNNTAWKIKRSNH